MDLFNETCAHCLGAEIYTRRKLSGLTLEVVAADVGTSRKTLASLEKGSRKVDFLLYLKAYLALGGSFTGLYEFMLVCMHGPGANALLLKQNSARDRERAKELLENPPLLFLKTG